MQGPGHNQTGRETYVLPVGTNMLRFSAITGYGNNLYLDNIQVGAESAVDQVFVTGDAFNIFSTIDMGVTWSPVDFLSEIQDDVRKDRLETAP